MLHKKNIIKTWCLQSNEGINLRRFFFSSVKVLVCSAAKLLFSQKVFEMLQMSLKVLQKENRRAA